MKLFSRKALVAGATALSMTFAGTTVATAAEPTTSTETVEANPSKTAGANTTATAKTTEPSKEPKEGSSIKDLDPDEIKAWIGVFTAVISALGTAFAFATKYLDLPFGK
ncbi:hypothetical protein [Corynebacterium tuberculostearicum]|uniref:hypothetical protein n=1 Tax=Corynebacterium tuberculostearicum TaxID=38304 RepID=UPI002934B41D|nr:hypothetical protein [Corynebacterium tuberculostearicum]MDV2432923.1 hypothetical protein [Corynebacterium tuberculostearicum]